MAHIVAKIQDFLKLESAAGILLIIAALFALAATNSALAPYYEGGLSTLVAVQFGSFAIEKPLVLWINDGLMAIFFLLVGLEIKREVLQGELSTFDKAALPIFAAIGGMAAPALVYAAINWGDPAALRGWAIPAATDIAFALGVLALMGARAPVSLKIFLLAVAIIDDLGAIAVIAVFYTSQLSVLALMLAAAGVLALFALNAAGVKKIPPYILIGVFIWVCVLKSGVHATMAGVLTALAIPIDGADKRDQSPLHRLEHQLHPWVAYAVLPLFAFANAGVSLMNLSLGAFAAPITLGVALGLLIGKPLGVLAMSYLAVRTGLARLPEGINWRQLAGVACLTGVGFTMSLFIGALAFGDPQTMNEVRLGVLSGSILSGALGFGLIYAASPSSQGERRARLRTA